MSYRYPHKTNVALQSALDREDEAQAEGLGQVAGLVVGEVGIAEFQVVKGDAGMGEVWPRVPDSHRQFDKAVARDVKRSEGAEIGLVGLAGRGHRHQPVLIGQRP